MSLINDALKRARESQRKDSPSGLSPLRPVETHCQERNFNLVLPVTISFLIVAALVLIGLALTRHANKGPAGKIVASSLVTNQPSVTAPVTNLPVSPAATIRPIVATLPAPRPLRLQGIVYDAVQPSAIIGGKAVYVGSLVDGMRVTAISPNSVTLAGGGHIKTLVVGEP
jgi:hypothetical protein